MSFLFKWTAASLLVGCILGSAISHAAESALTTKTVVKFASAIGAAEELGRIDSFIEALSPFDRAARKKTDKAVSQQEFLSFVAAQVLSWQSEEIERLTKVFGSIHNKITGLRLDLPPSIQLVKTTGQEEGGAAYCRGNNIILPADRAGASARSLEQLLTHELFHILSRNNPRLRDSLYAIVGFKPCGVIAYPRGLTPRKITNPDAPLCEHYITVAVEGKSVPTVPILFSSTANYDVRKGGEFFAYLTFKLMAIEQQEGRWVPVSQDSKPRLLDVADMQDFHDQIGRNTEYIIHPEEVLADNFALLVQGAKNIPTPRVISEMRRILSAQSP